MRAVVQRVSGASVSIDGLVTGSIGAGMVVLLAVNNSDDSETIKWFCNKLVNLRIFPDLQGKMNHSVNDIGGSILLISNFTVYGDVRKGFRPSFIESATPEFAIPLYNEFINYFRSNYSIPLVTGEFGAMMDISLVNDGPVTIIIDK
jgi:D-tyrosyl-tRNA(Tyr) deacylase